MSVYKMKPTLNGEGGGSGTSMYLINVLAKDGEYIQQASLFVDVNTLETYEDLFNYLINKGCTPDVENQINYFYPCSAYEEEAGSFNFIFAYVLGSPVGDKKQIHLFDGKDATLLFDDENFSITYLGNN